MVTSTRLGSLTPTWKVVPLAAGLRARARTATSLGPAESTAKRLGEADASVITGAVVSGGRHGGTTNSGPPPGAAPNLGMGPVDAVALVLVGAKSPPTVAVPPGVAVLAA